MLWLKLKTIIQLLVQRASDGDPEAARILAGTAIETTRATNDLQIKGQQEIKDLKASFAAWPLLFSPHPKFGLAATTLQSGVGSGLQLSLHSTAQWDPNDLGSRIAMELLEFTSVFRRSLATHHPDKLDALGKRALALPELPELARNRDAISKETLEQWWAFGRILFNRCYRQSSIYPLIRGLSKTARQRTKASDLTGRDECIIHDEIERNIRQKYLSILGHKHSS